MNDEDYFHEAAREALKATCSRGRSGAVLVKDTSIIGRGYNSPPLNDHAHAQCHTDYRISKKPKSDRTCCMHAEWRAFTDALKGGHDVTGSTLYFMGIDREGKPRHSGDPYCTVCSRLALDLGVARFGLWHTDGIRLYDTATYNALSYTYHRDHTRQRTPYVDPLQIATLRAQSNVCMEVVTPFVPYHFMEQTPKHFALQLGALITLYVSIGGIISLLFGFINLQFPDAAEQYYAYEAATDGIRWAIALLLVFFPAYLALTRVVNQTKRSGSGEYLALTKWLIYLSLLVGGLVMLGDLVAVILGFLNGELTIRFILKALSIFLVVGGACWYYFKDAKGYWLEHEAQSKHYGMIVAGLVFASIVGGYLKIEAPSAMRELALDQRQISDLGLIQSYVMNTYTESGALPDALTNVSFAEQLPTAPTERTPYVYEKVDATTFKLCATFGAASDPAMMTYPTTWTDTTILKNADNWNHEKGKACFTRIVAPAPSGMPVPVMKQ